MSKADFAQKLERSFVELVAARAEKKSFKKSEFAALLWPEMAPKTAASRWTSVRGKAFHAGKPQSVAIADAQRMADVLGEDLSYLLAVAK